MKEGDKAPDFLGYDQDGNEVFLSDTAGKDIILYFYPKDDTPGCTAQACNLKDNITTLRAQGFRIIGVSADNATKHKKFIKKYSLPFTLIADTDRKLIEEFGVWGRKKFMGREYDGIFRTTFVIGPDGIVKHRIEKVRTKDHSNQIYSLTGKE